MMDEGELKKFIREIVIGEIQKESPSNKKNPVEEDIKLAKKVASWIGAEIPPPPWTGKWRAEGDISYYLARTPARLNVGRVGTRYRTKTILSFLADHAAARDAVISTLSQEMIHQLGFVHIHSSALDKQQFLLRPDLGRKLSDESKNIVQQKGERSPQVQIVAGDGLSATAINVNLPIVFRVLQEELKHRGVRTGTPFIISNSRVACGDEVARLLGAEVLCMLVGERPGLKTAESMGAYVTYMKVKEFNEAMRSVISNIHKGGLKPEEGGRAIASLCLKALKERKTGVDIKI